MHNNLKKRSKQDRFLIFFVADELYGISVLNIKEIIKVVNIVKVPRTPDFLKGIINLRGKVVPVIDVRLKFGLEYREYDMETCIIIVEMGDIMLGFIVDRVEDVVAFETLHASPAFGSHIDVSLLAGVVEIGSDVVMILDLEKILDDGELMEISEVDHTHEEHYVD